MNVSEMDRKHLAVCVHFLPLKQRRFSQMHQQLASSPYTAVASVTVPLTSIYISPLNEFARKG